VDRLQVFKALGDNTRYAAYLELARSTVPLSTSDVAEALGLHPNTVRPHLERMRDVGLLDVEIDSRGTVGRPQHRYWVADDAPTLGLEPSAFRLLATLLAGVAAAHQPDAEEVAGVGRQRGRLAAAERDAEDRATVPPGAPDSQGGTAGGSRTPASACVRGLVAELAELGFDPVTSDDAGTTTVAFTRCPFIELATVFPDLVCHLHRGIVEGFVAQAGGAEVAHFATIADRDPCRVDLTAGLT
jgi:predicted ArsR family transcriptional regulator